MVRSTFALAVLSAASASNLVGIAVGVGASLVIAGGVAQATGTPFKCSVAKQKATAKKAAAKLTCYTKAVTNHVPVDPTCLLKADQAFENVFTKTEQAGGCAVTGDANGQEAAADAFVAAVTARETTAECTTENQPCGTTCGGAGVCIGHCTGNPANTPFVCIDISTATENLTSTTDVGCQSVLPGSIMVASPASTCATLFGVNRAVCAKPCP
jgi:hypothetical protein